MKKMVKHLRPFAAGHTIDYDGPKSSMAACSDTDETEEVGQDSREPSLQEQLDMAMQQSLLVPSLPSTPDNIDNDITHAIKTEMQLFTSSGNRGHCLQKAYEYLITIHATSVEAESAFYAAGVICSKLRSCLGDESIDNLCFLRICYHDNRRCH